MSAYPSPKAYHRKPEFWRVGAILAVCWVLIAIPYAFGNRVAKTANTVTTQYLVEDDVNPTGYPQVIEELSGPIGA
jgi:hypothetical protein